MNIKPIRTEQDYENEYQKRLDICSHFMYDKDMS